MFKDNNEPARKIIPRWRSSSSFIKSGGLETKGDPHLSILRVNSEIIRSEQVWLAKKDELSATEYVATLKALGDSPEQAQEAIDFLHSLGSKAFQKITTSNSIYQIELPQTVSEVGLRIEEISKLRLHLKSFPRDPIAWLDLAKLYTLSGMADSQQAKRAVQVATTLAPNNRYILRSAARFYIHISDPERAIWVLEHSKRSNTDPWLSSALISSREIAGKSHLRIKQSQQILDSKNWPDTAKSELSTAMGDLAIKNGKIKQGKKLYKNALIAPNENVLAQALWTQEHMKVNLIKESFKLASITNSFEAQAMQFEAAENWGDMLEMCTLWQHDEPYSSKPAIMGSHGALTLRTHIPSAIELLEKACLANPNEAILRNNLAFSYAISGNLSAADQEFRFLKKLAKINNKSYVYNATAGLLNFRHGNAELGREQYKESLKYFEKDKDKSLLINCKSQFLMEELRLGFTQEATTLFDSLVIDIDSSTNNKKAHASLKAKLNEMLKNQGNLDNDKNSFIVDYEKLELYLTSK